MQKRERPWRRGPMWNWRSREHIDVSGEDNQKKEVH